MSKETSTAHEDFNWNKPLKCVCGKTGDAPRMLHWAYHGWFIIEIPFAGYIRRISACSADCVERAKEDFKIYYRQQLADFERRVDEVKLRKVE
jgi:hypothetical protein